MSISNNRALLICLLAIGCGSQEQTGDADTDPCASLIDSDGDTIADSVEGTEDLDGDGIPNNMDDDSDGDTLPDSVEAGDDDLCSPPANTDWSDGGSGDEIPDFLDEDSDDDGLSDADERELGTNPIDMDSDGDGVTDYGEICVGTNPTDPSSTIEPGTLIVLPYMDTEPEYREFTFVMDGDTSQDITTVVEHCPPSASTYCPDIHDSGLSCCVKSVTTAHGFPAAPDGFSSMDETSFYNVNPGTAVTYGFDLHNDCVPHHEDRAILGKMCITALGDGVREIDVQEFVIIVPSPPSHGP